MDDYDFVSAVNNMPDTNFAGKKLDTGSLILSWATKSPVKKLEYQHFVKKKLLHYWQQHFIPSTSNTATLIVANQDLAWLYLDE